MPPLTFVTHALINWHWHVSQRQRLSFWSHKETILGYCTGSNRLRCSCTRHHLTRAWTEPTWWGVLAVLVVTLETVCEDLCSLSCYFARRYV